MVPQLESNYLKGLLELKNQGAVVMILSLKHQLSREGYYWYNLPKAAGFPFLALVEHTNFLPSEYFNGEHILIAVITWLRGTSISVFQRRTRRTFHASFKRINLIFSRTGSTRLALENELCTARPAGQPFTQYSLH
jgi:protoporphyrinogen oxidase